MITVHPFGDYAHRQPLAYAPIVAHCADAITVTRDIGAADIVLVAHLRDLERHGLHLRQVLRPHQRLVLLSEEPLWDTVWGGGAPLARDRVQMTPAGRLPFTQLNHATSTIFDFARIPAFLLTDPGFATRYARWFARNAALGPGQWADHFRSCEIHAGFIAEYREGAQFDVAWPRAGLRGLGAHRTRIALACDAATTLRMGAGWNNLPRRQDLPDWHLEKFLDHDGRIRLLSAIENTHQDNYISEKIFDAFAMRAVPFYIAGPLHRVHELAPTGSWLNLEGRSAAAAARAIAGFRIDDAFLARYAAAQEGLAGLFATPAALVREMDRLRAALLAELGAVLAGGA